jgi:hypothetical protein
MTRIRTIVTGCVALAAAAMLPASARAQPASALSGVWTLNRGVSEFPADIGFNPAWMMAPLAGSSSGDSSRGGRGGRSGGGSSAAPFAARPESYDDARLLQLLTAEARNPPVRLTITDTMSSVSFVNELGQSRTLHPDGRQESIEIQGVIVGVTAKRDGDQLIVSYRGGQGRELRYTYSPSANPPRLTVDLQFLERGAGDKARRVYEAGTAIPTAAPAATPASGAAPAGRGAAPAEPIDQRPGAELRGLTSVGILVEDLSPQAIACGLAREAIETALSKPLTAAGFTVHRNSDEDTYVYVNVMTSTLPTGLCVSRYDAFLYTHGTATLSYHDRPVLVQVSLMHRGGIGNSAPSAHPAAVMRGLVGFVDLFVTQIRDANK